mgnify:CR=1 FL=1
MKLHYSQTLVCYSRHSVVSVPYEITLLSNCFHLRYIQDDVSVPYEITLLSNIMAYAPAVLSVSVPYEITLLSNSPKYGISVKRVSVPYEITLLSNVAEEYARSKWFQYLMKLHYSQT